MPTIIEGTEYSFDCEHCKFCEFMKLMGKDLNPNTCWIDCTTLIKNDLDMYFSIILSNTHINQNGAILYTGNIPSCELGGLLPS